MKIKHTVKQKHKKKYEISKFMLSLLEKISTIHGIVHVTNKGKVSKIWLTLMFLNILLTIGFIMVIKQKFHSDQVVTVIDPNCKVNKVPFPAVSICNFNMVSFRESRNIDRVLRHHNISEDEIKEFFNALPHLKEFGKDSRKLGNFTDIMSILKHHYFTMDTIMEEVHQKCEHLLVYCVFNRKRKNCGDMFSMVKTTEGHCCTFNYAALNDVSEILQLPSDDSLEYYEDQDGDTSSSYIIATSESGRMSGVEVVFNVEPDDYPVWSTVPYYGVKVLISDPNDFPETRYTYRYVTPGQSVDIKAEASIYQSESNIRQLQPERRGCWFHDEAHLQHTNKYSYETCHTECKMRSYLANCGCVPYKYPRDKSIRICELEDLKCLNNVTVNLPLNRMHCKPVCYMECRDKSYFITSDLTPFQSRLYPDEVIDGHNANELSALRVYFRKYKCNCYKLTLLTDINYFIATYGGIFSLSFGGSIITLVELVYLFLSFVTTLVLRAVTMNFISGPGFYSVK